MANTTSGSSSVALLRRNPRYRWLALASLPTWVAVGAVGVARLSDAAKLYGGTASVGAFAVVSAIAAGLGALAAGAAVDRFGARRVFAFAGAAVALDNIYAGVLTTSGQLSWSAFLGVAALDAFVLALLIVALIPMQIDLVEVSDTGAAQLEYSVRVSAGLAIGTVVAGVLHNPSLVLLLAGVTVAASTALTWFFAGPPSPRPIPVSDPGKASLSVWPILSANPPLRSLLVLLIALYFVVPTQVVALVITDNNALHMGYRVAAGAFAAVITACIIIASTGLRRRLERLCSQASADIPES